MISVPPMIQVLVMAKAPVPGRVKTRLCPPCTPAQAALNWVAGRPTVASTIIGATSLTQLNDNLGALDFEVPHDELTEISSPPSHHPYNFFDRAASRTLPFMPDLDIRPQPR